MIRQLLFDCGGGFTETKHVENLQRFTGDASIAAEMIRTIWSPSSPWHDYDRGIVDDGELLVRLKQLLPERFHGYVESFVETWHEGLPPMAGMEEIVDALHEKGYPCYLLSDFPKRFEVMPDRVPALKKLDGMVVSYQTQRKKPHSDTFRHAAEILGIKPEETLFVDDLACNVAGAESIGMEGYIFPSPADLRAYLQERGIL